MKTPTIILKKGTIVKLNGFPYVLLTDTEFIGTAKNSAVAEKLEDSQYQAVSKN